MLHMLHVQHELNAPQVALIEETLMSKVDRCQEIVVSRTFILTSPNFPGDNRMATIDLKTTVVMQPFKGES